MSIIQQVAGVIQDFFSTDVVAVYNSTDDQVFADAVPMKASINPQSKPMEHPLESSVIITDHRVILPVEIRLHMIVPGGRYIEVYAQIRNAFLAADILQVNTKAAIFENMLIIGMPHEENPEKFDAIEIEIELKETLFASLSVVLLSESQVENPTQSSTIERGVQNPSQSSDSLAVRIFDGITGAT